MKTVATFKVKPHGVRPGADALEIWIGDHMVAALYQDGVQHDVIRLFSSHLINVESTEPGAMPAMYNFRFDTTFPIKHTP